MSDLPLRRSFAVLAAGAATVLLGACSPRATLIADPVFAELYLEQQAPRERLEAAAAEAGYRLEHVRLSEMPPPADAVSQALADARAAGPVVLSPYLAVTAGSAPGEGGAEGNGGAVLYLARPGAQGTGTVVSFDRRTAFRSLGHRFAEILESADEERRAVVYGLSDGGQRSAELAAMREGLGSAVDVVRFVLFEAPAAPADVREELFRLRAPNIVAVGAFVGPENALILDEVAGLDRDPPPSVAGEDIGPVGAYGGSLRYHVERDYAAAIGRFLSGERGTISVDSRLVGGDEPGMNRVR